MKLLSPAAAILLLLGLGACASPPSGILLSGPGVDDDDDSVGDDDDSVGDDDDSVGDDDDSVGDDDDSVGDDDDSVGDDDDDDDGNPYAGTWEGGTAISRPQDKGGEFTICEGEVVFVVADDGNFTGEGGCEFDWGGESALVFTGVMGANGELVSGEVAMEAFGGTTTSPLGGGIYEEDNEVYFYVWWDVTLGGGGGNGGGGPGGGGGGEAQGEAWGVRK